MPDKNKDHWYDGWFYEKIIAPNQDGLFKQIQDLIEPDSSIIDVGCGTGRFSFLIGEKCSSIFGIDISKRNIDRAHRLLSGNPNEKISFLHAGIGDIISENNRHFDYAVMTYVLHEIDEGERVQLLKKAARIADTIIIGDYLVSKPEGFWSWLNELVEFAAGKDHYKNYKQFISNGGAPAVVHKAGLKVIHEVRNNPSTSHIVLAVKQ